MRRNASASRENAALRTQLQSSIGRGLREAYAGTPQPLPDRLVDLVRRIDQSTGEGRERGTFARSRDETKG
jgi:hypothetical protein